MKITQVAQFVNTAIEEATGISALVNEDLSNVVDAGDQISNANKWNAYLNALVNHIGRVIFVDRKYEGILPKMLRDSWTFGSILEKVSTDLPDANDTQFMEPVHGTVYHENQFTKAVVRAKFYNERLVLEVTCPSITEDQLRQSFSSPQQLNSFISMIFTACENAMTTKIDALILRVINAQMVSTIYSDYESEDVASKSGVKARNLLYEYNQKFSPSPALTVANCLHDAGFLRYAGEQMRLMKGRISKMSKLFNVNGRDRFTTDDLLHVIMWADFASATVTYLQSSTFHDEMVALPLYEETPYWQGTGLTYDEAGEIDASLGTKTITHASDFLVLGCMFDEYAVAVSNLERYTPTKYVARMHFWNYWFQAIMGLMRDDDENFVVFFVA